MKLKKNYKHFCVTASVDGIVMLTLDVAERPMNVLTAEVMAELGDIISQLEQTRGDDVAAVAIRSGKESGFLAGADVNAIAELTDSREAAKVIELGQMLFQRIEWLPFPTIAVIEGPCMGGGLELALACRYRIARDAADTQLGLPEIKLGLIPGWGGTQRLPRLVGLHHALPMIMTGKGVRVAQAMAIGLIDESVDPDRWEAGIDDFVSRAVGGQVVKRRSLGKRLRRRAMNTSLARMLVTWKTGKSIRSKVKHYPALEAALHAASTSFDSGLNGFLVERAEFIELLESPACRSLIGLYLSRSRAQRLATWTNPVALGTNQPIQNVAVIGAGVMGAGIGQWAAVRGFHVILKEVNAKVAHAAQQRIHDSIDGLAARQCWSTTKTQDVKSRIAVTSLMSDLASADLVIEAVAESFKIKATVFGDIQRVVRPETLIVSNTSSLSIDDLAGSLEDPSRFAGLHFFNPVHRMELVEVVKGQHSDENVIARLVHFVRSLGKVPIVTNDSPGFIVNRILFPYLGEAMRMVIEGHPPETIDREVRKFGMPMGPIELIDQVGLDVALQVARSLSEIQVGGQAIEGLLATMVERGELGSKSERGFYQYSEGKKLRSCKGLADNSVTIPVFEKRLTPLDSGGTDDGFTPIQRRLVYPMLIEAKRCLAEHVVAFPWAVDLAMVLGTGFAPHRGGPLAVIEQMGEATFQTQLRRLRELHGDRFSLRTESVSFPEVVGERS